MMRDKLKSVSGYDAVTKYLTNTKWFRKMFDVILVCMILLVYGFATGKINPSHFYNPASHTVEHTFKQSTEIQKILDGEQYKNEYRFVGSYKFHNGTQGLDGFNFMKWSLTEYSTEIGVQVDPMELQNIPIVVNMPMVSALVEDKCYMSVPNPKSPTYYISKRMGIHAYTSCPIFSRQRQLVGFILVATDQTIAPDQTKVRAIVEQISIYRK